VKIGAANSSEVDTDFDAIRGAFRLRDLGEVHMPFARGGLYQGSHHAAGGRGNRRNVFRHQHPFIAPLESNILI
jgi:hypothetical protein